MAEISSSSESINTPSKAPEQAQSETKFPLLQDRIQAIPEGNTLFAQAIRDLSSLPISPDRKKIEDSLLSVDDDTLDPDIINLLRRAVADIKNTQAKQVDAQAKQVDAQAKQVDAQKDTSIIQTGGEKEKNKGIDQKATINKTEGSLQDQTAAEEIKKQKEIQEKNDLAKKRIDALYESFGGEEKFKEKNKDLDTWKETAKKELLSQDPKLASDPALETKVLLLALQTNQVQITKNAEGIPGYNSKILFRDIESSLADLGVYHIPGPRSITNDSQNKIASEVAGYKKGDVVIRRGNQYIIGDQVVDISTRPPTRSTEQLGLRITPSGDKAKEEQNMKNKFYEGTEKKENELSRLRVLMGDINNKVSGEKADLNKIAVETFHLSPIETLDEKSYDLLIEACDKATEAEANETDKEFSRKLKLTIQAKKDKYLEPMGLQAQQSFLPDILTNIQAIEQQLTTDKLIYQASLSKFANNERSNLSLLNKSGFPVLGQEKLNFSVSFINESRKGQTSLNPIDLGVPLNQKDENALIRIIQLQLGEVHKDLFVVDENNNTKLAPGDSVQEKIKSALFAIKNVSLETFRAKIKGHDLNKPVEYKKNETPSDSQDKQKPDGNQEKTSQ